MSARNATRHPEPPVRLCDRGARVRALASKIEGLRQQGEPGDAAIILSRHPELAADKSIVLDLLYDEYCQQQEAGTPPDPDEFCERFPAYRSSLGRLLRAHSFLSGSLPSLPESKSIRWPEPGQFFLGFFLVRELGRGGFARVFLAAEPALGDRLVAVKVSVRGSAEAETLGRLSHPNIVPVHSVQTDPDSNLTVVCMPYLGGATLCDVLDHVFARSRAPSHARVILEAVRDSGPSGASLASRPSPWLRRGTYIDGILHIAVQLADALAFVHSLGICHRDLKPSNVLMSPDGRSLLLDFNLAADAETADFWLGGTLPYMSPEQLRANGRVSAVSPSRLDARSDLFSLGVILYELLTGAHPFGPVPLKLAPEELRKCLIERQQHGPQPLQSVRPEVDYQLAQLIERCLASDPGDRPQSAADLAAALRRGLSLHRRCRRWAGKHLRGVLAATLLVLVAGVAGGYSLAVRDPYSVRQLHRGQEAYRQGDYYQAVSSFNAALDADPNLAWAAFARGRAHQRLGNISLALADYQSAGKFIQDGRIMACQAYCLNRLTQHKPAVPLYEQAIKEGFVRAEVWNNLGYSQLHRGEHKEAKAALDRAIELNPGLQAAFYNRALVQFQMMLNQSGILAGPALADIRTAIELGPETAELYRHAAGMCATAGQVDAALEYLRQAIKHGQDPRRLQEDYLFRALRDQPQFQALIEAPVPANPPQKALRLVDPVND